MTTLALLLNLIIYSLYSLRAFTSSSFTTITLISPLFSLLATLISFLPISIFLIYSLTSSVISFGYFSSNALYIVTSYSFITILLSLLYSVWPYLGISAYINNRIPPKEADTVDG